MIDKIPFDLFGLHLQEPMALITNWLMSVFSLYAYFKLKNTEKETTKKWSYFFISFSISTFFGGLGHLFFQYFGIPGKFPNWIFGIIAGYFAGKAMLIKLNEGSLKNRLNSFLILKGFTLLILSVFSFKFIFVAIDAILTYIIYCGILGYRFYKDGFLEMRYMVYGVLICLPSVFIFFFKINPHRWLNKDDLSHLFMLACIYFFYLGAIKSNKPEVEGLFQQNS